MSFGGRRPPDTQRNENEEVVLYWRVWWEKPEHWRFEEVPAEGTAKISVINGERWWQRNSTGVRRGTYNSMSSKLRDIDSAVSRRAFLDPSWLLATFSFNIDGPTTHIGRDAIHVVATRRPERQIVEDPFFWDQIDELDLLIDAERGILLSYRAQADGITFASATVEQVSFDDPIPATRFELVPACRD